MFVSKLGGFLSRSRLLLDAFVNNASDLLNKTAYNLRGHFLNSVFMKICCGNKSILLPVGFDEKFAESS